MKRFPSTSVLVLGAFAVAAAARSEQDSMGPRGAWGHGVHRMEKCLASLNLPDSLKADIDSSLTAGHATLKTDVAAIQAAHAQMETDLANSADKAVLGQDVLNLDAARQKMKADAQALHDQVLAQLSPDQQDAVRACAASHAGHEHGPTGSPEVPNSN